MNRLLAAALTALVVFGGLANAAHDYWAATLVYLGAIALTTAVLLARCWPKNGPGISLALLAPLGAAAGAVALSFRTAARPAESWFAMMDWLAALLLLFVAQHVLREEKARRDLAAAIGALAAFECALVLHQHWALIMKPHAPMTAWGLVKYWISMQLPGTLVNSSVATGFLLSWTPLLAWQAWESRKDEDAAWRLGAAAAIVLAVFSLDSTWGIICLLAGAPFLLGPRKPWEWAKRNRRTAAAIIGLGALAVAAAFAWKFMHRVNLNGEVMPPGETTRRLYWWKSGLAMLKERPAFGIGIGNFPTAYPAFKVGDVQNTLRPHNWLVGLLAETGLVGTGALLGALCWGLWRARRDAERLWPFLFGPLLCAAFGLLGLTFEYLAVLMSAAILLGAFASSLDRPAWKPRRSVLLVLVATALFLIPSVVSPWLADRNCVEGAARLAAGDAPGAERAFASAASLDPRSDQAELGWGLALAARGARAEAGPHLRRAAELNPLGRLPR